MTTHTQAHAAKLGGNLFWRIAGFILAVTLIVIASGFIGGFAGRWVK